MVPRRLAVLVLAAFSGCGDRGGDPPPAASSAPVVLSRWATLARVDVPGFARKGSASTDDAATPWYLSDARTAGGARLAVAVTVRRCGDCKPLDVTEWRLHREDLETVLPEEHRRNPDRVFDLFYADLDTRRGIALHKRSLVGDPGSPLAWLNALTVWWHDGHDSVVLDVEPRHADGWRPTTPQALEVSATRDELLSAARTVFREVAAALARAR